MLTCLCSPVCCSPPAASETDSVASGRSWSASSSSALSVGAGRLGRLAAGRLVVGRALMGIGAALIFPATLAVITNVFCDAGSGPRRSASGVRRRAWPWRLDPSPAAGCSSTSGGDRCSSSISVPVVVVVMIVTWLSRPRVTGGPCGRGSTRIGAAAVDAAIGALVLHDRRGAGLGLARSETIAGFTGSALVLIGFVAWERRIARPDAAHLESSATCGSRPECGGHVGLLHSLRLHLPDHAVLPACAGLPAARGRGADAAPVALSIAIAAVVAPAVVQSLGTTQVVRAGLVLMTAAFLWIGLRVDVDTSYLEIVGQMVLLGVGLGATTSPATESIMDVGATATCSAIAPTVAL